MEENSSKTEEEESTPVTEEEYAEFLKNEKKKNGIIKEILDFFFGLFHFFN